MEPYQQLEKELAEWSGMPHVVACSSGTAALHLALESLRLPPGSEVILPDYTMIACARAVTLAGITPVFVDCGSDLLMRPHLVRKAIEDRGGGPNLVGAIMAVHVYGRLCDMEGICAIAKEHNLPVIEDCAESHGAGHPFLTYAKCWSFYKNKIIRGEEGGAVAFLSDSSAAHARCLRSLGFTEAHDFRHVPRGHNYRMANVLAGLIRRNLALYMTKGVTLRDGREVDYLAEERRRIEGLYNARCPAPWRILTRDAVWVYDLRIPGMTRVQQWQVVEILNREGIAARHGFAPMSEQEEYSDCRVVGDGLAARLAPEVVYLPVEPGYTTAETVERSFAILQETVRGFA